MHNRRTGVATKYHDGTKHPGGSLMDPRHMFDPMRRPAPYKVYSGLEPVSLPLDTAAGTVAALVAVSSDPGPDTGEDETPTFQDLAGILYYSAGVTRRIAFPWGEMPFRAAACTGALYHIELYVVCGDLPGLEAGVYHFDPQDVALTPLRRGDHRRTLVEATAGDESVVRAPAVVVYTDVFWRNACKYQAREYRHAFWDSGTIMSHSLAVASARRVPARVVAGFVDREVNNLLGLDTSREVALAMVTLGAAAPLDHRPPPRLAPLSLNTGPVPPDEKTFPAILELHRASSLDDAAEVESWRRTDWMRRPSPPAGTSVSLRPAEDGLPSADPLETVVLRRGSTRRFNREAIGFEELSTVLDRSLRRLPSHFHCQSGLAFNDAYLIVHDVAGLAPGAYLYRGEPPELELLREGEFRDEAGHLGLDQALAADASVNVYLMAELAPILDRLGNRGYRVAQLEAGIAAGRVYLSAYALRLGATGLTFYDDEVTEFFSPHARGKSVMFLVALGKKARRR